MLSFQPPTIAQFTYVIHFKDVQEKIRFAQGDAEVAFGSFGAGQSQQTNVPDATDPAVPRLLFVKGERSISISSQAIQLQHTYPAPANSSNLTDRFLELVDEVQAFHAQALDFERNGREYGTIALIVAVNYPSEAGMTDLHKYFLDRFLKIEPLGDLASASFSAGFRSGDFFLNINGGVYELRQFDLKMDKPSFINPANLALGAKDSKVISKGVQFTIDVNDRPRLMPASMKDGSTRPEQVIELARELIMEKLPNILQERALS
jgi:hypothetical protein